MEFLLFIGGVILLVVVINLSNRVKRLENMIRAGALPDIGVTGGTPSVPESSSRASDSVLVAYVKQQQAAGVALDAVKAALLEKGWQMPDIEQAVASAAPPATAVPGAPLDSRQESLLVDQFTNWLKEDWLLKLGALLLLIGFSWLTTYAFLNNWIGPMGRIALGIIAGAVLIMLGWWRIGRYINQGGVFLVLGSTTILLTIFAAREIYGFFTPLSALVVMFLSTAFVALASVKYNSRILALVSLVLAGIAPLLTNAPSLNYIALFSYLLVVVFGALWIVAVTGRRELTAAALILIALYSIPLWQGLVSADRGVLLLFAYVFTVLFFITNTFGILSLKDKRIVPDLVTAAGNGLFVLTWIMTAAQEDWRSLIISAWMIVFAVGAFVIYRITHRREPFYVYAGVGVAMLAAATAAELDGATLTIAYTVECGVIALITYAILRDIKVAERLGLLFIGPILLSIESMISPQWRKYVLHEDFFVLLIIGLIMLGIGAYFLQRAREAPDTEPKMFNAALLITGSIFVYILLWLSLHAALKNNNTAVMISLFVYTVIGLVAYFYGLAAQRRGLRLYGAALVGFVVIRLLFVDVWTMEIAGRIVTFFLIGALLVSTAFLGRARGSQQHKAS